MIRQFTFYKEPDGRWFIELPEWEGPKEDLEMVQGADQMLDLLAKGQDRITLTVSEQYILGFQVALDKTGELKTGGATYGGPLYFKGNNGEGVFIGIKVWLCDVTKFVYGYFPETLYISYV